MRIADYVARFLGQEEGAINMQTPADVAALAVLATRFYWGYAALASAPTEITDQTEVNESEWALIYPLFRLYWERKQAIQLEATGMLGVQSFGRQSSEIVQDIRQVEAELPLKAFMQPVITV